VPLLLVAAPVEAMVRAAVDDVSLRGGLVLGLLAVATTLPSRLLPPAGAAGVVVAAALLSLAPFHCLTVAGALSVLLALHRLGRHGPQWAAGALAAPFVGPALLAPGPPAGRALAVLLAGLAPAAGWAGAARRARHEADALTAHRRELAGTLLEHTARGERARISRELHDVVAHHISMIAVQAETARLTTPALPAVGAERLSAIGDTARAALTEMRRLLGVLREDTGDEPARRQPQPGLHQLNELLDAVRDASGSGARLILRGRPVGLDPGVELAAYRIVQEALTNARRHAPGAAVDVELHYTASGLDLQVRDNGPGPADEPAGAADGPGPRGHGLVGMRERAVAVGGELQVGAAPGGGFLVAARLPGPGDDG
jgi:signal transduction histidine kinase